MGGKLDRKCDYTITKEDLKELENGTPEQQKYADRIKELIKDNIIELIDGEEIKQEENDETKKEEKTR